MARSELPNGIILPAEYSDDWYDDMTSNLSKLDEVIGSDADKLSAEDVGAAALSNDYTDLDNKPALKPVATSGDYDDLDNKPALKPVATSGDYDDLDNKPDLNPYDQHLANTDIHVTTADKSKWNTGVTQAYVLRYSSTAITDNSTIAYSTLDNTDNIKVSDKIIDTDGKIFSIVSVDSDNSTVTVGSALIDLALDANVVHTNEINSSGIGIIGAVKEVGGVDFNTLTTQGLYGVNASGSTNNPVNLPCVVQVIKRQNSVIQIANVSSSAYKSRYIRYCADITAQSPVWQSWIKFATDDNVMHLSGNETAGGIKTFSDGINTTQINNLTPSSLSMPATTGTVDISGYVTDLTGNTVNTYSPVVNGYIVITCNSTNVDYIKISNNLDFVSIVDNTNNQFTSGLLGVWQPCVAGIGVQIRIKASALNSARFIPCQGNI